MKLKLLTLFLCSLVAAQGHTSGDEFNLSQDTKVGVKNDADADATAIAGGGNATANVGDTTVLVGGPRVDNAQDQTSLQSNIQSASFNDASRNDTNFFQLPEVSLGTYRIGDTEVPVSGFGAHVFSPDGDEVGASVGVALPIMWGLPKRNEALDAAFHRAEENTDLIRAEAEKYRAEALQYRAQATALGRQFVIEEKENEWRQEVQLLQDVVNRLEKDDRKNRIYIQNLEALVPRVDPCEICEGSRE